MVNLLEIIGFSVIFEESTKIPNFELIIEIFYLEEENFYNYK
jgi:hypothetical protein